MYIIIALIHVTYRIYNLTLYSSRISFTILTRFAISRFGAAVPTKCGLLAHRSSGSVHTQRIFVRAPNSWATSARTTTISCSTTGKGQLAFHPHRFHSLTRVTRVLLYETTIHTGHHCGPRTPAYRLEWIVSSTRRVAPRGASSPHAPTVRTTVLSRVRSTRVCARYTSSSYSSAYLSLLLEGPRTAL